MKYFIIILLLSCSAIAQDVTSEAIKTDTTNLDVIRYYGEQRSEVPNMQIVIDSLRRLISQTAPEGSWDDERVPIQSVKVAGLQEPEWVRVYRDAGETSEGVYLYCFDDGPAEEEVFFTIQFPHSWNGPAGGDSTIYPHVHWLHTDVDTGGVVWGLEYTWASVSEGNGAVASTFGATSIIYSGAHPVSGSAPANEHLMTNFAGVTKPNQGWSSMMICRLFRANVAGDNKVGDACVLEIDFHIQKRPRGTKGVYQDN